MSMTKDKNNEYLQHCAKNQPSHFAGTDLKNIHTEKNSTLRP